jgi:hypothetical protein
MRGVDVRERRWILAGLRNAAFGAVLVGVLALVLAWAVLGFLRS